MSANVEQPKSSQLQKNIQEILETDLSCAICQDIYINPLILNCSHSFCKFCIYRWLTKNTGCPQCRIEIAFQAESVTLRNVINRMIQKTSSHFQTSRDTAVKQRLEDETEQEKDPVVSFLKSYRTITSTEFLRTRFPNSNGDSSASSSTGNEESLNESEVGVRSTNYDTTEDEDEDEYERNGYSDPDTFDESDGITFEVEIPSTDSSDSEMDDVSETDAERNDVWNNNPRMAINWMSHDIGDEEDDEDDDDDDDLDDELGPLESDDEIMPNLSYTESSDSTNTSDDEDDDMNSNPSRYSEQSTIEYGTSDDSD